MLLVLCPLVKTPEYEQVNPKVVTVGQVQLLSAEIEPGISLNPSLPVCKILSVITILLAFASHWFSKDIV